MTKICVMGMGYIGLPTAAMFATHGLKVIGVDVNDRVVETLKRGDIHIEEPGLKALVQEAVSNGNFEFANQPQPADAFIIAVPTPFLHDEMGEFEGRSYKKADMSFVASATEAILPCLRHGNLVILESTSPPSTTLNLVRPILERSGLKAGVDFYLAYSPERVLPGQILKELVENARVIGGIDRYSAEMGRDLYASFVTGEIILTNSTTAEMVKLMENTYRDVNIAISNEFSRLADFFGIDVWEAISVANRHPRVKILNPGPGVGGHCISVDPWFFVEAAPHLTPLIHTARRTNDSQPHFVLDLVKNVLSELKGKRIAALGLAYKPNVDDLRESPAIDVVNLLVDAGACVNLFEPFKPQYQIKGAVSHNSLESVLKDADAVILLVKHSEFQALTPADLIAMTPARILIDTVNGWENKEWEKSGFKLFRLGVGI